MPSCGSPRRSSSAKSGRNHSGCSYRTPIGLVVMPVSLPGGAPALEARLQPGILDRGPVDHVRRHLTTRQRQAGAERRLAVAPEALVGPAERVRRHYHVVELEDRILLRRRLLLEDVEP